MLHFKGFQAVQCYRITNFLWNQGRQSLAVAISVRVSELFAVDIHPAATIGRGVMLDHATGIVIGETAVVGDNVSMLHHVSLGGSGIGRSVRHPTIGHGVLLGAGVAVLGPVKVGAGCKVGAGSVVVADLPDHVVAVGVPARIVKRGLRQEPVRDMDSCADFILDYVI
jgi:serine O-acetyltransferase